jgi:dTDP-4-amino-4,6-dideoxygalactose transaminase
MQSTEAIATAKGSVGAAFPFLDLKAQYATIRDEVNAAVLRVLESQHFILGPEVTALESDVASYVGVRHALSCASGSDALLLALMALGVGPGDEVVTTPFTFVATAGSIARLHARPVFVDIDPVTFNLDPAGLEAVITPRTKAIMPVHLFGLTAGMDAIQEIASRHNLPVIEDAAQAIGARYQGRMAGSIGAIGCFSFFPSKNLGGGGDGGMLTTNDDAIAARLKLLRVHGSRTKYEYQLLGLNSRLDAMQAAILRVKLPHLDAWADGRRRNAEAYRHLIAEAGLLSHITPSRCPVVCDHVYNQYTIRTTARDALRDHLRAAGIPTEIYYPYALHTQAAFANLKYKVGDFPEAEKAGAEVISLPIYPELSLEQLSAVVNAIAEFFSHAR